MRPETKANTTDKDRLAADTRCRIRDIQRLAPLPTTSALLVGKEIAAIDPVTLAQLVARDPALAATVLRHANVQQSPEPRFTLNIANACDWLGAATATTVREATSAPAPATNAVDWATLQHHGLVAGIAARCIGQAIGYRAPEDLYTAGLLHPLGRIVLDACLRDSAAPATATRAAEDRLAEQAATFGLTEAEAGFLLAEAWGIPPLIGDCIRQHRSVQEAQLPKPAAVVALAVVLAEAYGSKDPAICQNAAAQSRRLFALLHLAPSEIAAILKAIRHEVDRSQEEHRRLQAIIASIPCAATPPPADAAPAQAAMQEEAIEAPAPEPVPESKAAETTPPPSIAPRVVTNLRVSSMANKRPGNAHQPATERLKASQNPHAEPPVTDTTPPTPPPPPQRAQPAKKAAWRLVVPFAVAISLFVYVAVIRVEAPSTTATQPMLPAFEDAEAIPVADAIASVNTNPMVPETAGFLRRLGNYYYDLKNYEMATTYYARLVESWSAWPGTRYVYLPLADCYTRLQRPGAAQEIYRKVLRDFSEGSPEYDKAKAALEAAR